MARKGAIFDPLSRKSLIVYVTKGDQPDYTRGPHARQTSARLRRFQSCIANKLTGQRGGGRSAVRARFGSAAEACKKAG